MKVGKKAKHKGGPIIAFDPAARKEFIEGFSKRKAERRKAAAAQKARKDKAEKRRVRQERREALKRQITEIEAARFGGAPPASAKAEACLQGDSGCPQSSAAAGRPAKKKRRTKKEEEGQHSPTAAPTTSSSSEVCISKNESRGEGNSAKHVLQYFLPPAVYQAAPSLDCDSPPKTHDGHAGKAGATTKSDAHYKQRLPSSKPQNLTESATAAQQAPWLLGGVVKTTLGGF